MMKDLKMFCAMERRGLTCSAKYLETVFKKLTERKRRKQWKGKKKEAKQIIDHIR